VISAPKFQHLSSGGLALVVHGMFLLALVISMSWKNMPHLPVQADLWAALPSPKPVDMRPIPEPMPELKPEPRPEPKPELKVEAKPEIKPEPKPEPPPVAKPQPSEAEIALKKAEEEKKRLAEEELRKQEEARKLEEKRLAAEKAQREQAELAEKERIEQLKKKVQARKQMEQELARQSRAELEREQARLQAQQAQVSQAALRDKVIEDFKSRIQAKVQSYVRLPQRISGNPEAIFQVTLFANGEVRDVTLVKSSGQQAYDVEVERAILKASPLPLPDEKEAAAVFRNGLVLKFRPN